MAKFVGIDPSTATGFVVIDENGQLIEAKEIVRKGEDPARMITLIDDVISLVQPGNYVAIEGFGFASQQAIQMGGIGWGLRMALHRLGIHYVEPAPNAVKKFCGAKGNAKKEHVSVEVYKRWGFEHKSNNVVDAFVIAHLCRAYYMKNLNLLAFQQEVIQNMKNPPEKRYKKKAN
ncbi:crossover junction endodeoxyribonuclease RuvC [Brevibacillus centrosporus]|uniref:crossover junction endodeoxyribonuclease RuvC n=1 Tax=Brevibacillus centrosporus TaxID=54910 RepID=UPI002E1F4920|nr:crossover junction endodeoxyribonuclease RuvC [Brevibacillus centrosporus]MED1954636.1 crossover junction endodeoxyribonuclease RuvC [Brevibacillus centrosporus]